MMESQGSAQPQLTSFSSSNLEKDNAKKYFQAFLSLPGASIIY